MEQFRHFVTQGLGLLLLAPLLPAMAQDLAAPAEEQAEIRRYTVEVIVFRYAQDVSVGSEVFLPDELEPVVDADSEMPGEAEEPERIEDLGTSIAMDEEPQPDMEIVILEDDAYSMIDILDKLDALDVYEPLMHFGWTQAALDEDQTDAIELATLGEAPAGLSGNLTLYLGRYLHLIVDLQLDADTAAPAEAEPLLSYGDYRTLNERYEDTSAGEPAVPAPVRYRLREDRILKNGDLRYFDHPRFGVLAKVTRVEETEIENAEGDAEELLGYPAE